MSITKNELLELFDGQEHYIMEHSAIVGINKDRPCMADGEEVTVTKAQLMEVFEKEARSAMVAEA